MSAYTHVASVRDGAVIRFRSSAYNWIKCCDSNGQGGVVNLHTGLYIRATEDELARYGFFTDVTVVAMHADELY